MALMFARIELRGNPGEGVYQKLHAYMQSNNWYRTITGTKTSVLPHATYQATNPNPSVTLITQEIQAYIKANIWTNPITLVIVASEWAEMDE